MFHPSKKLLLALAALLALSLTGCAGKGRSRAKVLEHLPDFNFTKLNGHPIEKMNLELDKEKKLLLLYFSRAYQRG